MPEKYDNKQSADQRSSKPQNNKRDSKKLTTEKKSLKSSKLKTSENNIYGGPQLRYGGSDLIDDLSSLYKITEGTDSKKYEESNLSVDSENY